MDRKPPADGAASPFFAILSRSFVCDVFGSLSRGALHVYAYLRTWCTGPAGSGSGWVEVSVRKIAGSIGRSIRHVRRGLAELRSRTLIEAREQADDATGQRPNRWRVLPEPGFATATDGTRPDPDVEAVIREEVFEVVEAIPVWAGEAADELEQEIERSCDLLRSAETDPNDVLGARPGTSEAARRLELLREGVDDARRELAGLREAAQAPGIVVARSDRWWSQVVSTVAARSARRLEAHGLRARVAAKRVSEVDVGRVVGAWLLSRGG